MLLLTGKVGEKKRISNIGTNMVIEILGFKNDMVLFGISTDQEAQASDTQATPTGQEKE